MVVELERLASESSEVLAMQSNGMNVSEQAVNSRYSGSTPDPQVVVANKMMVYRPLASGIFDRRLTL